MDKNLRFAIIGAGMAGILAAIKLREAGHKDVVVLEKGDSVGGTWRENRYPGLACDVPAHSYTYSFAPNPDWSSIYSSGPEVKRYFEKVAVDFDLLSVIRFNTEVTSLTYHDPVWRIETNTGTTMEVDVVIAASGVLHVPNMPQIEGLDSFAGPAMHTARWDTSVDLNGKRIGVIGNGSTGVQIISALGGVVPSLVHFQRTPQWVMERLNRIYTDAERAEFRANPDTIEQLRSSDEAKANLRRYTSAVIDANSPVMQFMEDECRANLERNVADPELRAKLTPNYRAVCKRLVFSPDYYAKVQMPGVYVETGKIARIEPTGVLMEDGVFHELDVLALATGFQADRFIRPTVVLGRDGKSLDDFWRDNATAYYAISLPDFPNLFMLNGPSGPVGNFSLIDIAERQWGYIEQLIAKLIRGECRAISPRSKAMTDYEARRRKAALGTIWASGCRSWYLDKEGVPMLWPWSYDAFSDAMAEPVLEDFEFV